MISVMSTMLRNRITIYFCVLTSWLTDRDCFEKWYLCAVGGLVLLSARLPRLLSLGTPRNLIAALYSWHRVITCASFCCDAVLRAGAVQVHAADVIFDNGLVSG
jgi:hypothetical protein